MDGAVSTRKYPAYTTAQLEAAVASGKGTPAMVQEIADRKSGTSKPLVVPQIVPGRFGIFDNHTGERVSDETYTTAEEANHDYYMNHGHTHVGVIPHS